MFRPPGDCPVCGDSVPRGRRACPHCGADEKTGWADDDDSGSGLDLPDEDFNYDEFVAEEFGKPAKPRGLHPVWWITGIILLVAFVALYFFGHSPAL